MPTKSNPAAGPQPGTYQKDGATRLARTPQAAVQFTFAGFKRVGDLPGAPTPKSAAPQARTRGGGE